MEERERERKTRKFSDPFKGMLESVIKCRYSILVKYENEPEATCHRLKHILFFPLLVIDEKNLSKIFPKDVKRGREFQFDRNKNREMKKSMKDFWEHGGPATATSGNGIGTEHNRHFENANFPFDREVPKPGWKAGRKETKN